MVLIDATAQRCVMPLVLQPQATQIEYDVADDADTEQSADRRPLFDAPTFVRHIVPRIVQLFGVRETQTRLVLLRHFAGYQRCIDEQTMRARVLPELLLGIKDTDDQLVAATLRSLADLVPVLGAETVIGRNRGQIFVDGRPKETDRQQQRQATTTAAADLSAVPVPDWMEHRSITPVLTTMATTGTHNASHHLNVGGATASTASGDHNLVVDLSEMSSMARSQLMMLERLSPDGGEDEKTASDAPDLETDAAWSDWEADGPAHVAYGQDVICGVDNVEDQCDLTGATAQQELVSDVACTAATAAVKPQPPKPARLEKPATPPEIDYFADMEPVIEKTSVLDIADSRQPATTTKPLHSSRLAAAATTLAESGDAADADADAAGGWGYDVDAWGDDDSS